ncbi:glutamate--tRNA ligase [Rhodospirillum rubrum]|uniref:Glutamate--tRNA ligase 2 n=1 Tax=Rhodospirillum rubrum (strain ATCC 11170 / ATH 1.1.1 / DSM 467 / LMG 4362 / NCIMB 8255 / S1) TaxID=269796 RepID=SYE2_RHORT|nr:glutamate--tRNA ligase [Rhodospirillum rubrum]Q2RTZ4.1 RecName: Full=Glutamate--tRNA ligase 2; AltName: Full=Glutamyl-tRNA synthetase 2; Short=GluRS 2 [Rhodospirillum rubrum ATCC 11170]ABC22401.1 glutamyl-tRNA synthetase [Rhodospirillum rubrum ATCC 11170]AEO48118.1 glutamyl-tRNA synthetase [Rhodospirillum rubrum F11]MBK5953982.1 glutamate--tRNA ligase [Rhodospirillum rubrum]QXG82037.1 glutamate--tRNA ligase [Rhodospirillum rubrum]HCF17415.1 glutamate--tRNA ligase [Rhodospirillum rubrum]
MTVVTRFAPSPTGFLHIGGARTALFNWLFARHHGGRFLLRIEDTDRVRSTPEAVAAIFDGLEWLGLDWDEEPTFQFARAARHAEAAHELVAKGLAYRCYCTPDELTAMREEQKAKGLPPRYNGLWRDRDPSEAPAGVAPVIRLKAPQDGETTITDSVQGAVTVANNQLDDMILLRSDGTPTYMLSVVVDDHDMGVTHVIRGDDHLTNAFRQTQLYWALGWETPVFAHIPLIHGADGAKLSKRHGALGAEAYRDMGFLPEALRNYLVRLGWAHGDDEVFTTEQAVEWFSLESIGRSPSRFDMQKLTALNGSYMRETDDDRLTALLVPRLESTLGLDIPAAGHALLRAGMAGLKERAKTLVELADLAAFYVRPRPLAIDAKAEKALDDEGRTILAALIDKLDDFSPWTRDSLENLARVMSEERGVKLGKVAQPIRAALTGSTVSPPIFEVMEILGPDETLGRLRDAQSHS